MASNRKPLRKTGRKSAPATKPSTKPASKIRPCVLSKEEAPQKTPNAAVSKQDRVLGMLRAPSGTTVTAIMKATGWQQHSVRGFFAGTVRRKLELNLTSERVDGSRVYRVAKSGTAT